MKTGTAFCYVTDGRNDPFMRKLSMASLRRFCGDVPVFTCTAKGLYAPMDGENLIDAGSTWDSVFGQSANPREKAKDSAFPLVVYCKLLLPLLPRLACFERVVAMDDDIEVLSPAFADMPRLEDDADVGLVPGWTSSLEREPGPCSGMWPRGAVYHAGAPMLHRTDWTPGYVNRVKQGFMAGQNMGFRYPEEFAANLFLRVQTLPGAFAMVPACPETGKPGCDPGEMETAYAAHYGGTRKKAALKAWMERYPEVKR